MASTYSPSLRIELIGTGDQGGTWGITTNTNLGSLIEQAITGVESIAMLDAEYTLTALNGAPDESRNAVIEMTGTLTANQNVIIPAENKTYIFVNGTTGGYSIVVKTSTGVGITIPAGATMMLYCDGTDCFTSTNYFPSVKATAYQETKVAVSASNIDLSLGNYFSKTISGATTFTVSNVPATGTAFSFILDLTNAASSVTWWSGVDWANGVAPTLTTSGRDSLGFYTYDGGTTWSGFVLGKDMK